MERGGRAESGTETERMSGSAKPVPLKGVLKGTPLPQGVLEGTLVKRVLKRALEVHILEKGEVGYGSNISAPSNITILLNKN